MYNNNTYTNNTHKKVYQNSYTNIPEQYINIMRNGPDENTVIRGYRPGGACLVIWIKPKIRIGVSISNPQETRLEDENDLIISETKITEDFGAKWIPTFKKLFPDYFK